MIRHLLPAALQCLITNRQEPSFSNYVAVGCTILGVAWLSGASYYYLLHALTKVYAMLSGAGISAIFLIIAKSYEYCCRRKAHQYQLLSNMARATSNITEPLACKIKELAIPKNLSKIILVSLPVLVVLYLLSKQGSEKDNSLSRPHY